MESIMCLHCGDVFNQEIFFEHCKNIVHNHNSMDLAILLERVLNASDPVGLV